MPSSLSTQKPEPNTYAKHCPQIGITEAERYVRHVQPLRLVLGVRRRRRCGRRRRRNAGHCGDGGRLLLLLQLLLAHCDERRRCGCCCGGRHRRHRHTGARCRRSGGGHGHYAGRLLLRLDRLMGGGGRGCSGRFGLLVGLLLLEQIGLEKWKREKQKQFRKPSQKK